MTKHWRYLDRTQRIAAITTLRDAGKNRSEIAAELDVTVGSLHGFVFRQQIVGVVGANPRRTGGWYDMSAQERLATVKQMTIDGMTPAEMSEALNLNLSSVYSFCARNGFAGASNRKVVLRPRAPEIPDDRDVDSKVWAPLAEPVDLLSNTGCCWPVDGGQCGLPKHRKSYCSTHYHVAYPAKVRLSDGSIEWLAKTDDRAPGRTVASATPRGMKRESVRYDDE